MARPVFLAAPERGAGALSLIEALLRELQVVTGGALKGSDVFVPHLQVGDVGVDAAPETYFARSLGAIQEAQVVIAVLDGPQVDEHVAFLVGYAFAAGKPVIGYRTDHRATPIFPGGALRDEAQDIHALQRALARVLL